MFSWGKKNFIDFIFLIRNFARYFIQKTTLQDKLVNYSGSHTPATDPSLCFYPARSPSHLPSAPRRHGRAGPQPEGRWALSHAEAPSAGGVVPTCHRRRDRFSGCGVDEAEAAAGTVAEIGGERFWEKEQEQPRG